MEFQQLTTAPENETGVLIVGHGERGGHRNNQVLLALRDRVAAALPAMAVEAGVLNGAPSLELALRTLEQRGFRRILVYPFFMSDGYFVGTVIPQRMESMGSKQPWRVLPPLGLDPALPALIHSQALSEVTTSGWDAADTRLLMVGHGSAKSRASAEATLAAASAVAQRGQFLCVETAFLEEPPYVGACITNDPRPTLIVGFFSAEGLHARDDIPAVIAGTTVRYGGPVGADPAIAGFVVDAVRRAVSAWQ